MKGIKQVKNYRLLREIGKGLIGTIYEAVDDGSGKKYAIKSIQASKLQDKKLSESFRKQLKTINSLNHEHIIKVVGIEKTVNNTYLVIEFCNGGSLADYARLYENINKLPIPEVQIQFFIRQIIQGFDYMIKNNLLQRDQCLENILLNFTSVKNVMAPGEVPSKIDILKLNIFESTIKLADLGYTVNLDDTKATSSKNGRKIDSSDVGEPSLNEKPELYSLGIIAYNLLLGVTKPVLEGKFKVSLEIISFINSLLNYNSDKRSLWQKISEHPFIFNNINSFNYIWLQKIEPNEKTSLRGQNNDLWLDYKADNIITALDEILTNSINEYTKQVPLESGDLVKTKPEKNSIGEQKSLVKEEIKIEKKPLSCPVQVEQNKDKSSQNNVNLITPISTKVETKSKESPIIECNHINSKANVNDNLIEERPKLINQPQSTPNKHVKEITYGYKGDVGLTINTKPSKQEEKSSIQTPKEQEYPNQLVQNKEEGFNVKPQNFNFKFNKEITQLEEQLLDKDIKSMKKDMDLLLDNKSKQKPTSVVNPIVQSQSQNKDNSKVAMETVKSQNIVKNEFKEAILQNANISVVENVKHIKTQQKEDKQSNSKMVPQIENFKKEVVLDQTSKKEPIIQNTEKSQESSTFSQLKENLLPFPKQNSIIYFPNQDVVVQTNDKKPILVNTPQKLGNNLKEGSVEGFVEKSNSSPCMAKDINVNDDIWEIISTKSIDNTPYVNIEGESGLHENMVILDYFK